MTTWRPAQYADRRRLRMPPLLDKHTLISFAVLLVVLAALAIVIP